MGKRKTVKVLQPTPTTLDACSSVSTSRKLWGNKKDRIYLINFIRKLMWVLAPLPSSSLVLYVTLTQQEPILCLFVILCCSKCFCDVCWDAFTFVVAKIVVFDAYREMGNSMILKISYIFNRGNGLFTLVLLNFCWF